MHGADAHVCTAYLVACVYVAVTMRLHVSESTSWEGSLVCPFSVFSSAASRQIKRWSIAWKSLGHLRKHVYRVSCCAELHMLANGCAWS